MKVNSQSNISFKNIYTNKAIKKGLEFAADNGALFGAGTALGFSILRPLSIWLTPNAQEEDKTLAMSKSIVSSFIGFLLTLGLSLPLSKSIKKIDSNPQKYLSEESISKYKNGFDDIYKSKSYSLATQSFKLGLNAVTVIPKSIMVAAGIPYIDKVFSKHDKNHSEIKTPNPSFKGKPTEGLAKTIGSIIDKKGMRNFADKYKDTNFPMHIIAGTDILATGTFCYQVNKKRNIKDERKQTLINNSLISTGLSLLTGYTADKILDKPTQKFILNFEKANANDKNLAKQIQGIKIAKPILILGSIYYIAIPFISTFFADKFHSSKN